MSYQVLSCPVCGSDKLDVGQGRYFCRSCGSRFTDDSAQRAYETLVKNIDAQMSGVLDEGLRREKERVFYNLRNRIIAIMVT